MLIKFKNSVNKKKKDDIKLPKQESDDFDEDTPNDHSTEGSNKDLPIPSPSTEKSSSALSKMHLPSFHRDKDDKKKIET